MTDQLVDIRKQMLGEKVLTFTPTPEEIQAKLRAISDRRRPLAGAAPPHVLQRHSCRRYGPWQNSAGDRCHHPISQKQKAMSLIVCPTSLLYNWKEELAKFNPELKVIIVDGVPSVRKRLIEGMSNTTSSSRPTPSSKRMSKAMPKSILDTSSSTKPSTLRTAAPATPNRSK